MSSSNTQRRERPLSPHLQVYRPQLTSVLSILHRLTGVALSIFSVAWIVWLLAIVSGPAALARFQSAVAHPLGVILGIVVSWALFYHLFNGIRHLVWDTGRWLTLRGAYASGWSVVALSIVATAIAWGVAL